MFCKVIINSDVMKRRHKKCQNVSRRSEDRAALWLPRRQASSFSSAGGPETSIAQEHFSVQHSEASGEFSRNWLE